jgi:hypothetical protein
MTSEARYNNEPTNNQPMQTQKTCNNSMPTTIKQHTIDQHKNTRQERDSPSYLHMHFLFHTLHDISGMLLQQWWSWEDNKTIKWPRINWHSNTRVEEPWRVQVTGTCAYFFCRNFVNKQAYSLLPSSIESLTSAFPNSKQLPLQEHPQWHLRPGTFL